MRRTRLRLQVGMAGAGGVGEQGRRWEGRRRGGRGKGKGRGRQVAWLESEGVKRSPSHFCCSASPEGLHAQPPPRPDISDSATLPLLHNPPPPPSLACAAVSAVAAAISLVLRPPVPSARARLTSDCPPQRPYSQTRVRSPPDYPTALSAASQASLSRVATRSGRPLSLTVAAYKPPFPAQAVLAGTRAHPDAVRFAAIHLASLACLLGRHCPCGIAGQL